MAMPTQAFPWNTLNTLVGDYVVPNVATEIYQSNALLMRLNGRKKHVDGGRQIQKPAVWKIEGGGGGWFTGTDVLDTTVRDTVTMLTTTMKAFYVPIVVTWDDEQRVRGKNMIRALAELKGEQARFTAEHMIANDLYNDGSDPMRVTGLQYIFKDFTGGAPGTLATPQSYLGVTRAGRWDGSGGGSQLNNWFMYQADNTAYSDASTQNFDPLKAGAVMQVLGKMWAQIGIACGGNRTPTIILSNWGSYTCYHNSLALNDRYVRPQQDSKMAEAGYDNLKYKRAIWLVDEKAPRTSGKVEKIYFLNENTIQLFVHEAADFAFEPFRKPVNQMARVAYVLWMGELVNYEPRANGVISNVTTSTNS